MFYFCKPLSATCCYHIRLSRQIRMHLNGFCPCFSDFLECNYLDKTLKTGILAAAVPWGTLLTWAASPSLIHAASPAFYTLFKWQRHYKPEVTGSLLKLTHAVPYDLSFLGGLSEGYQKKTAKAWHKVDHQLRRSNWKELQGLFTWNKDIIPQGAHCILRFGKLWKFGQWFPFSCYRIVALGVRQVKPSNSFTASNNNYHLRITSWPKKGKTELRWKRYLSVHGGQITTSSKPVRKKRSENSRQKRNQELWK